MGALRILTALLGGDDGTPTSGGPAPAPTGADECAPLVGGEAPVPAPGKGGTTLEVDPDDEPIDPAELACYIDPWWIGTLGITLTKFFDDFASEIYNVPLKYYKYTKLDLTGYQDATFTLYCDLPGQFEIVFLLLAVCFPIFGKRAKYSYPSCCFYRLPSANTASPSEQLV